MSQPKNLSLAFFFTSKSSALILSLCSLCLRQLQLQVAVLCRTFSPGNFFSEQRYLPFCGRIHFTIALGGDICQQIQLTILCHCQGRRGGGRVLRSKVGNSRVLCSSMPLTATAGMYTPPSSPNAGSHTFKFNRFILLLTTPQATPTQDQITNNVAANLPLESKQIDLRELQHVINDDLPLPLSHGNPLPQMWPLLIFCSVSIYSLMAGNAGGLYHNCSVNEAQMLVPRMQIFFSFQVREGLLNQMFPKSRHCQDGGGSDPCLDFFKGFVHMH